MILSFNRGGYYYAIYGKKIVQTYRKPSGPEGNDDSLETRKEPTFREFVQYLLDTDVEQYDEHWRPIFLLCTPCHVRFDIIAKMETLKDDSKFVLSHRDLSEKVKIEWSHKTNSQQTTSEIAEEYFSQLTKSEVKQLYLKYLLDFIMFEYDPEPYYKIAESSTNSNVQEEFVEEEENGIEEDTEMEENNNEEEEEEYDDEYEEDEDDDEGDEEFEEEFEEDDEVEENNVETNYIINDDNVEPS